MSDLQPMHEYAFHGLLGKIVRTIEPHSEADPAALLAQCLAAFGNVIGRNAYFEVEARRHYGNLFFGLVGATAKGRKGTAWAHVERLMGSVDSAWVQDRTMDGLSSGEGLINAVRDPVTKIEDGEEVTVIEGVPDKRALVVEEEFAAVLRILMREGNILSEVIRKAWDTGRLRTLVKTSPLRATDAHISLVGHITANELARHLSETQRGNGFANRFLMLYVRRSKFLPEGGGMHREDVSALVNALGEAVTGARKAGCIEFDGEARALWHDIYAQLSSSPEGLLGVLTARAEAQTRRLAMIYALADGKRVVGVEHLLAALAFWDYAYRSTDFIFGDALADPMADQILRGLHESEDEGLTQTEIHNLFGRHKKGMEIQDALGFLFERGLVRYEAEPTGGRPMYRWWAVEEPEGEAAKKAKKAKEALTAPGNPFPGLVAKEGQDDEQGGAKKAKKAKEAPFDTLNSLISLNSQDPSEGDAGLNSLISLNSQRPSAVEGGDEQDGGDDEIFASMEAAMAAKESLPEVCDVCLTPEECRADFHCRQVPSIAGRGEAA